MKPNHCLLVGALLVVSAVGPAPAASAAPAYRIELGKPGAGSTNVTTAGAVRLGSAPNRAAETVRTGFAGYPLAGLAAPANTFAATVDATVPAGAELAIDVRGRSGGQWSEWTEIRPDAPAVLPAAARDVEVRAMLSTPDGVASPQLRALTVAPTASAREPSGSVHAADLTYEVFATREGLIADTTANGHVITARDHFVALPSRRGLSNNGTGDYSVRVCASNGRCAWAPIWPTAH